MKVLRSLLIFYINSSIHLALSVIALTFVTDIYFGLSFSAELSGFIFFATITAYNFVKYAGIAKLHHRSLAKNLRVIQVFSLLCFIALFYFVLRMKAEVLIAAGLMGLLTALYAVPFLGKKRNLRDIAGLKIFVIAAIWAGVTVLLPIIHSEMGMGVTIILEVLQRFLFILILILPFEIRDLRYDRKELRTLPQRLGVGQTKLLGHFLIVIWVALEFFKENTTRASLGALLVTASFTAAAIFCSSTDQSRYYSSLWVEGIPILWLLWLLVFGNF